MREAIRAHLVALLNQIPIIRRQAARNAVFDNLNNAIENGYYCDLDKLTAYELINELQAFAEDVINQNYTNSELLPHVNEWIRKRRAEFDRIQAEADA
jgi:nucleoid-associated protein YejK